MAMKKTHDAVYAGEKYTDRNGEEKTRFINIGALLKRDDGSMSLKLETIPVGFTGWINFYEPKAKDDAKPARSAESSASASRGSFNDDGDDIPFAPAGKRSHYIL